MENYYLYSLAIWLVSIAPLWLAHFVGSLLAEISFVLHGRTRRVVYRNLEHVLPPGTSSWKRWSVARGAFRNFSYSVIDFFRIPRMTLPKADLYIADCKGWEYLEAAQASAVGGVFATLHMGSWELAGVYLGMRGVPLTAAALPHHDPRINQIFLGNRESWGMEVVPVGGALAKLEDAVSRGRFIGLVVDRDINGHGPVLPFFGQPARVPNGHVLLALRTGAWIIPVVTYRRPDGKLVIDMAPPIIPDPATDSTDELVLRCLQVLEGFIGDHPDQWSMFYDLWKQ
jgi:lauroyl/myristoyl acyltransferase